MKSPTIILVLSMIMSGCNTGNVTLVSDQPGPPTNAVTPTGFAISPVQAYEIVRNEPWALSLKHIWHIYADDENYYVIDSFLGSNPRRAVQTGIVIDGQTGKIKNRTSNKAAAH